jgi:hypothetical protein
MMPVSSRRASLDEACAMKPAIHGFRLLYTLLWLGLIGYGLLLSPPAPQDLLGELVALARADSARVDPIAIAVFNLLGVLPTAFLAILLFDTGRPSPWPFAIGAYFLGGIILLPYLAIRDFEAPLDPAPRRFLRVIGSRAAGWILLALTLMLLGFAVVSGSPVDFADQLAGSKFIAVMSADLIALTVALHLAADTDRRRRGLTLSPPWQHLPLLGPLLYLSMRPPVTD